MSLFALAVAFAGRRPWQALLMLVSVTVALTLAGLVRIGAALLPAGSGVALLADGVAGLAFVILLFPSANAAAQTVRDQVRDFAVLKALGFSACRLWMVLLWQAALPCGAGVVCALLLIQGFVLALARLLPGPVVAQLPPPPWMLGLAACVLVPLACTALAARRLSRLPLAGLLARP
ncbi:MAG: hypothetical protein BGN82_04375 [Alphaproteobacteria bacterium 65-7]|nr:MAG: hypothetical protein BGN82_04375 [Alphaproteobacteria bacterium 65-7]